MLNHPAIQRRPSTNGRLGAGQRQREFPGVSGLCSVLRDWKELERGGRVRGGKREDQPEREMGCMYRVRGEYREGKGG